MTCDIYLNCLCQWNAKNKKKMQFRLICRVQWSWHSAKLGNFVECQDIALGKDFFKKKQKIFAECQAGEALGKELFKKNKKCLCQVPCRRGTRQRVFEKKMSLPSALTIGTRQRRRQRSSAVDGCFSLPSVVVGTRKRLCRVPDK